MKQIIKKGSTSKRMSIFIADSSSTTGAGLTGLVYNSGSLVWYYWREDTGNAGGTSVTLATATRGTFTSGGFKEIDATNMPGWYEIGIPDAVLASGAYWAVMMLKGATNMAPCPIEIQLVTYDPTDGNLGLTGLAGLTAPTAGALITAGTGTAQISVSSGVAQADIAKCGGSTVAAGAIPNAAANASGGLITYGTSTGQLSPSAGGVAISTTGRDQIWAYLTSDATTANSLGKLLVDNLNASVSAIKIVTDIVAGMYENSSGYRWTTHALMQAPTGGSAPSAATVAAAVWDELKSAHTTAGTYGYYLDAAVTSRLAPTTSGRTLDVSAGGEAGVDWANIGSPTTTVNFSGTTVGTVTANSDKTGYALTSGERNSIADAWLVRTDGIETGVTPQQALRYCSAMLVGVVTGAGTGTEVFKAIGNSSTTRVTMTDDSSGNRSAVTLA